MIVVNPDIHLPPATPHVQSTFPSTPLVGCIGLKHDSLGCTTQCLWIFFEAGSGPEKLPSLSSHDLLTIRHAHAVWMCVSIKILLLLEVATQALALGYRTVFVL